MLRIGQDLADLVEAGRAADLHHAASNAYLLLHGAVNRYLVEAAAALAERERLSQGGARADAAGRIADLHELLPNPLTGT
ncbi:MAG: hypothetical protein FIB01_08375 [Gemmatimonadetes bacterium]|nr:hypothetical protein [Gemmatimonadota bacterium]